MLLSQISICLASDGESPGARGFLPCRDVASRSIACFLAWCKTFQGLTQELMLKEGHRDTSRLDLHKSPISMEDGLEPTFSWLSVCCWGELYGLGLVYRDVPKRFCPKKMIVPTKHPPKHSSAHTIISTSKGNFKGLDLHNATPKSVTYHLSY